MSHGPGARRTPVLLVVALLLVTASSVATAATTSKGLRSPTELFAASTAPASTGNLLPPATALTTAGTGTWKGLRATVARAASPAAPSGGTLAVTASESGAYPVATTGDRTVRATPGNVYTATLSLRAKVAPSTFVPTLQFFSATGVLLQTVRGQAGSDPVGRWADAQPVVALAPATAAYVALRVLWQSTTAGVVHYVARPVLTTRPGGSRDVVGPLVTVGNEIRDRNGPLVLRGLHRFGFEGSVRGAGFPNHFSQAEVARAKAWGANMIRLSLASSFWLRTDCHYDPTYAARVDEAVQWITTAGMVALIDLHYNSTNDCSAVAAQRMADARAPAFWKSVATRYRGNLRVAFDLYNEPHDISEAVWRNGGQVTSGGKTWTATGMQALYLAVRKAGATNLVIASGNSWGNAFPSTPLVGTNLAYGVHAYTCPNTPTGADCRANPLDPSSILASWVTPGQTYPVVVSEFGWPAKDDGRYVRNVIAFAEKQGWGWSAFAWDGSTLGNFDLLADVEATYQPSPTGMPVLQGFGANR